MAMVLANSRWMCAVDGMTASCVPYLPMLKMAGITGQCIDTRTAVALFASDATSSRSIMLLLKVDLGDWFRGLVKKADPVNQMQSG